MKKSLVIALIPLFAIAGALGGCSRGQTGGGDVSAEVVINNYCEN